VNTEDRDSVTHRVKSWTHLFNAIRSGAKLHDIRDMTERDYRVGDLMLLEEFDHTIGEYTGERCLVEITYITDKQTPCAFSSAVLHRDFGILSIVIVERSYNEDEGGGANVLKFKRPPEEKPTPEDLGIKFPPFNVPREPLRAH